MFFDQNFYTLHGHFNQTHQNLRNDPIIKNDFSFKPKLSHEPFEHQTFIRCSKCGSTMGSSCNCWMNENKLNNFRF